MYIHIKNASYTYLTKLISSNPRNLVALAATRSFIETGYKNQWRVYPAIGPKYLNYLLIHSMRFCAA